MITEMPGKSEGKISLSICIPTYNRPTEFERLIKCITPQLSGETEVVIRDDSPNNETRKLVEKYLAPSGIRYQYFQGEKMGLDAANLFVFEKAKGEYVWWFSDDDEMASGAISHLLTLIKKHPEITFAWANFISVDTNTLAVPDLEEGFFKDRNDVLDKVKNNISLLSTLIFKREEALPSLELAKKHVWGFSLAALLPIFYVLSRGGRFYFLKGPYVICHPGTTLELITASIPDESERNAKGKKIIEDYFQIFAVNLYYIFGEFKDAFDKKAAKRYLSITFGNSWRTLLVGWIRGYASPRDKIWITIKLYWKFAECWLAVVLFIMPRFVDIGIYHAYKALSGSSRHISSA
jgi:glycosyltransferase involved in cell wall biosynthesis